MAEPNEKPKPDGGERVYVPQKPPVVNPTPAPAPQGQPESTSQKPPPSGSESSNLLTSDQLREAMVVQRPPIMGSRSEIGDHERLIGSASAGGSTIRALGGELFVPQKPPVVQARTSQSATPDPQHGGQAEPKTTPEVDKAKQRDQKP